MARTHTRSVETRSKGEPPRGARRARWFRFGPGLLLAVIASVVVWRLSPPDARGIASGPPRIERTQRVAIPDPPPSAPDSAWLLEQREALQLTPAQVSKLSRLRARWDRDTRALRGALAHASAEFDQSMRAAGGRGQTMEQLQERAAPVSQLSRQLSAARRAWWSEAATVLTAVQRRNAEQVWAQRLARK